MTSGLNLRMAAASALLALLIVSAFSALFLAIRNLHESTEARRQTREMLVAADELETLVVDLETGLRGYVITRSDSFLAPWRAARAAVPRHAAALQSRITGEPQQSARARRIAVGADAYVREYGIPLLAAVRRGDPSARSLARTAEGKRRTDRLRDEFERFRMSARTELAARESSADVAGRRAIVAGAVGVVASLLLIFGFTGYLSRLIVWPIRRAAHMADRLAGGDLRTRMPETGAAEMGMLERSLNTMAGSLEAKESDLERLLEQQSSLRRVATLVAREVAPAEIFGVVTREVGLLSGADVARMERYETDGTVTGIAGWSRTDDQLAVGTRIELDGVSIASLVLASGGPARVDDFAGASGAMAEELVTAGLRASVGCPIVVSSRLWGVIAASSKTEPFPEGTEEKIADFTELVATAIANAESRAELAASRARVVAAADETRRRIERDLHDGIQQRLASLALDLRGADTSAPAELGAHLTRVEAGVIEALEDLREISRGIHPAILSKGGLTLALRAMARSSAVPVELAVSVEEKLPEPVEVAAYYVASEALANVTKHAQASSVQMQGRHRNGALHLSISDDGVGGADPARGSGLIGLTDRVAAVGGTISVRSPVREGTSLEVTFPLH
jgi:signal transduction histidine kinase